MKKIIFLTIFGFCLMLAFWHYIFDKYGVPELTYTEFKQILNIDNDDICSYDSDLNLIFQEIFNRDFDSSFPLEAASGYIFDGDRDDVIVSQINGDENNRAIVQYYNADTDALVVSQQTCEYNSATNFNVSYADSEQYENIENPYQCSIFIDKKGFYSSIITINYFDYFTHLNLVFECVTNNQQNDSIINVYEICFDSNGLLLDCQSFEDSIRKRNLEINKNS